MSNPSTQTAENRTLPEHEPATIEQLVKLNLLVTQQKPKKPQLQAVMRFIPDILKSPDLERINRFDLCRLLGTPMPIEIKSGEFHLHDNYSAWTIATLCQELRNEGIKTPSNLDSSSSCEVSSEPFFLIQLSERKVIDYLGQFDLALSNLREFLCFCYFYDRSHSNRKQPNDISISDFDEPDRYSIEGSRASMWSAQWHLGCEIDKGEMSICRRIGISLSFLNRETFLLVRRLTPDEQVKLRNSERDSAR